MKKILILFFGFLLGIVFVFALKVIIEKFTVKDYAKGGDGIKNSKVVDSENTVVKKQNEEIENETLRYNITIDSISNLSYVYSKIENSTIGLSKTYIDNGVKSIVKYEKINNFISTTMDGELQKVTLYTLYKYIKKDIKGNAKPDIQIMHKLIGYKDIPINSKEIDINIIDNYYDVVDIDSKDTNFVIEQIKNEKNMIIYGYNN